MPQTYYTMLTDAGARYLAIAQATGSDIKLKQMAVGDGGGTVPSPNSTQTALINQKYIADLSSLDVDETNSAQYIAEMVIREEVGDFWIREAGLFTDDGTLFAVCNYPETYKPIITSGASRLQTIRMIVIISSTQDVTLTVDPSITFATRNFVESSTKKDSKVITWANRLQEDKNKENPSIADFGYKASDTDNTDALQAAITFSKVNNVKVLLPEKGDYYYLNPTTEDDFVSDNELKKYFAGGGRIKQKISLSEYTKYAFVTATPWRQVYVKYNNKLNSLVSSGVRIGEYKRIGNSPNNVVQGYAYDEVTGEHFTQHNTDSDPESASLNYYNGSIIGTDGVYLSQFNTSLFSQIGHQGLSIERITGDRWFWASLGQTGNYPHGGTNGQYATRFQFDGATDLTSDSFQFFKLFGDEISSTGSTTPSISSDGKYLIAKGNDAARYCYRIRVFDLQKLIDGGAGDYSDNYDVIVSEFSIPCYDIVGRSTALQSLASNGEVIAVLFNNDTALSSCPILLYTLDGQLIDTAETSVGLAEATEDTTLYEPEALQFATYDSHEVLLMSVSSGAVGARVSRTYALSLSYVQSLKRSAFIAAGGEAHVIDITSSGSPLAFYRRGAKVGDIYTSGANTQLRAFRDNNIGLIAYKSDNTTYAAWRLNNIGFFYPEIGNEDMLAVIGRPSSYVQTSYVRERNYTTTIFDSCGDGSPEGVVTASKGSIYRRSDGGSGTSIYVKESGTGNTGWVAK